MIDASQVSLVRVKGSDPFHDYPALGLIWPEPYHSEARFASRADAKTGQIFYIVVDCEVVGITGYWIEARNEIDVWLRWHGVEPDMRGKGVAKQALKLLLAKMKNEVPATYTRIVELVPKNDYGREVAAPFFEKFGFVEALDISPPPAEAAMWGVTPVAYSFR